jgi:protein gp37
MPTKIEWTDETWNPIIGCSKISEGCQNCYAEKMAHRLAYMGQEGYAIVTHKQGGWNGRTYQMFYKNILEKPLHWKKPRKIFVCSMGDLFHKSVPFEWVDKVMAVIALCPQHTFQVLTKRADRMKEYFRQINVGSNVIGDAWNILGYNKKYKHEDVLNRPWPLPNLWLGVTAENQQRADERIPLLLQTPAAKRFVSCEPMLGEIKLYPDYLPIYQHIGAPCGIEKPDYHRTNHKCELDWVIVGGETGHNARMMQPIWVRTIRDQCKAAGVPFFFKKWGTKAEKTMRLNENQKIEINGVEYREFPK